MEDPDSKAKPLSQEQDLFFKADYKQCKKLLSQAKNAHLSIELNSLLCDYKENPQKAANILQKIMDILVALNIKLYQQRPQPPPKNKKGNVRTPKINHQFYFWNIIVLSQLLANPEIVELIANEALCYSDSLRTETSLMILYQMLKTMESTSRLASCIALIQKQNRLLDRVKKLTQQEQTYRFMNQILFCKVLLKLGMIDGGRIMYMMKFNQNLEQVKEDELTLINGLHVSIHQQFLHAEIEYRAKNYPQSLKILSEMIPNIDTLGKDKELIKHLIDHNVALILLNYKQSNSTQFMINKTLNFLVKSKDLQFNNERFQLIAKCKDNILLAALTTPSDSYQRCFQQLKTHQNCYSFRLNYRKAQLCLNYYHELLKNPSRVVTFKQVHDFYQTVYYYPNLPYFQQKGKNKNLNYTNKKFYFRRYVLSEQEQNATTREGLEARGDLSDSRAKQTLSNSKERKEPSKEKREKASSKAKNAPRQSEQPKTDQIKEESEPPRKSDSKLKEILSMCEWFLKESLVILQKQKNIIVNLEDEEKGLTEQVNEKLYSEYINYKSSIYSILCYVSLCKQEWTQTLNYASLYQSFEKQYQLHSKNSFEQQIYYNILTYKTEAYCQLNRTERAYDLLHDIVGCIDYANPALIECRTGSYQRQGETYFESMTQYNNFGFNLSVLHSRDNKIPEAYNSIQKLLQQMRVIPTNPQANLPLSLIELLIHYNLRTSNQQSALQLIKRRRILNLPGVIGHYNPTLSITK